MRRPRSVGEAQGWRTVDRLARKFEYPDERTFPTAPAFGGGGGAPTIVIAAANSLDIEKQKADFVCTGFNDQTVIQSAIEMLAFGGRLLLCSGTFNIAFAGSSNCIRHGGFSAVTIEGMGPDSTWLNVVDSFSGSSVDRFAIGFENANMVVKSVAVMGGDGANPTNGIIVGARGHIWDVIVATDGIGAQLSGGFGVLSESQLINGGKGVEVFGNDSKVLGCHINVGGDGVELLSTINGFMTVANNTISFVGGSGIVSHSLGVVHAIIADNQIHQPGGHGIAVGGDRNVIQGNLINAPGVGAGNTFDGISVNGNRNYAAGNKVIASGLANTTRYGVNIGGDCNIVVGNDLGEPAGYGSDALNDSGTDTQLFYPAHVTYGDNFTDCASSSPTSPASPTSPTSPTSPASPTSPTSPTSPPEGAGFALLGDEGETVSTPDSAQLGITGDIDIRTCIAADEWDNGGIGALSRQMMIGKWVESGNQRSWRFSFQPSGSNLLPFFAWSVAGSSGLTISPSNTIAQPNDGEPIWLRVALDVDNGNDRREFAFYWSDEPPDTDPASVTWTLISQATGGLGSNTSIFDSTAPVSIGRTTGDTEAQFLGKFYYAEVRDGIDGTIVANPDFRDTTQADWSQGSGDDDEGNTWTFNNGAVWSPS